MDFLKYWKPETFEISSYKYGLDGRKGNHLIPQGVIILEFVRTHITN
jgi:hypothetical protein